MSLYRLIYVSRSKVAGPEAPAALNAILATSRDHNARHDITGALLFSQTRFTQVLEGEETVVKALLERIRHDPRNEELNVIMFSYPDRRRFEGWAMGYAGLTPEMDERLDPLIRSGVGRPASKEAQVMLDLMKDVAAPDALPE